MNAAALQKVAFDEYTLRARVLPALIVGLPVGLGALAWFRNTEISWGPLSSLIIAAGGVALLAQLGRDLGKRKQPILYKMWSGEPAVRLLRHRDAPNAIVLERRHKKLQELLPDQKLPTSEQERIDPHRADIVYQACVAFLKERTRDKQRFPLVFEENCNYGFRRNLWGMKPLGVLAAGAGTAAVVTLMIMHYRGAIKAMSSIAPVAAVLNSVLLLAWLFWLTPRWVRIAADAYAERLLATCDAL